jgi:glycosyltransferase involved in cell wall biosynthesis
MTSSQPLVSVIIIFWNAERFMQAAVESVFAQTDDRWELILVDDGSTDASSAMALGYAGRYPGQVRYFEHADHQNRGMSASRNLGIRRAQGDFIALLDADDVWLPRKLEQQIAILKGRPGVAMVYGPTQWWYSWTGKAEDQQRDFVHALGVEPNTWIQPPTLLVRFLSDEGISPCTCSMLVRREVLERIGGFEENFRGLYEDQALCAKICLDGVVFASDECWYRYRQHPDSACAVAHRTGTYQAARLIFLNWLAAYLSDRQIKHPDVWRALERERWRYHPSIGYRLKERTQVLWRVLNARARGLVTGLQGGDHA